MPDWMRQVAVSSPSMTLSTLCLRLIVSFLLGLAVVGIYKGTRRTAGMSPTFPATLVLLAVLIATVSQVIDDNVARAFSLVGALSVVRFRTVVRDTKDTVFVIAAVVAGMAAGTGQITVALIGLTVTAGAAALFRDGPAIMSVSHEMHLSIRMVWTAELETRITAVLLRCGQDVEVLSVATIQKGVGMELTYQFRLLPTTMLSQVVSELSHLEGVQSVELKREREDD